MQWFMLLSYNETILLLLARTILGVTTLIQYKLRYCLDTYLFMYFSDTSLSLY